MGKIILNGIPYTAGKVNDVEVNSASIVDQNGIAELAEVAVSGSYNDLSDKPTIPSDENVTQTSSTTDGDFEVLFSGTADNVTRTEGVRKSNRLLFNPRYSNLQLHKVTLRKIVSQIDDALIVTQGHTDNDVHYPERWTDDTSTTREQGGRIVIKMPTNGHENGIFLSINNGINYSPIALQNNALRNEYPSNMFVELIYDEYGTISTYPLGGGKSKLDVTGIWRVLSVINYDHMVTQNNTSGNYNYRILLSGTSDDVTRREEVNKSNSLKFNPSTGNLQATQLNGMNISDIIKFHVGTYSGSVNQYSNLSLGSPYAGKTILGATVDNTLTYVCVGKNTSGGNMLAFRQIQTDAKLASGTAVSGYVFYSD